MRSCSVRLVFPPSAFGRTYWSLPLLLFCLRGDGLIARPLSCPLPSNPHPLRYSRHPRPGLPLLCRRLAHPTRSLTAGSPERRAAPLLPLLARPFMCLLRLPPHPPQRIRRRRRHPLPSSLLVFRSCACARVWEHREREACVGVTAHTYDTAHRTPPHPHLHRHTGLQRRPTHNTHEKAKEKGGGYTSAQGWDRKSAKVASLTHPLLFTFGVAQL